MKSTQIVPLRRSLALLLGILAASTFSCAAPMGQRSATALPEPAVSTWASALLGRSISQAVYLPDNSAARKPVVVYLKNLPSPRIGRETDEVLIASFLSRGMIVIAADYERHPRAVPPELLPDIDNWYSSLYNSKTLPVDPDWIYIVPEGYAIERNIHVCDVLSHRVGMDVFYPSGKTRPVPAVLQIGSTKDKGKWINQRAYYIYGLLTAGYAGAIMDWTGGASVMYEHRVFPEKRAARLLRGRAQEWNLSGKLGVTGHSKGSSRAAAAALINEDGLESDFGPYPDQSARFQAALLSAGQHDKEHIQEDGFSKRPVPGTPEELQRDSTVNQITPDDPPLFLSIGAQDEPFRVNQMKRVAARCKEVGLEHRFILQEGMGHMYNPRPQVIAEIFAFFHKYLKAPAGAGEK